LAAYFITFESQLENHFHRKLHMALLGYLNSAKDSKQGCVLYKQLKTYPSDVSAARF
jgi:hypothetical protein